MEKISLIYRVKQYVSEFLLPVDNEIITIKKFHVAAIVKLAVIVPTIYLLTLSTLLTYKKTAYNIPVSTLLLNIWFIMFFLYIASNISIIISTNLRAAKTLTYLCVFLELASNQICLYSVGSLASHIVIFFIICVCIYRVFFDYYISLFCSVACCSLYIITAILEFSGIIPISPYLVGPLNHQVYSSPPMAFSFITAVVTGVFITFFAVNFSMNQILKLNRYIMENWKSDISSLHEFTQNTTAANNVDDIIDFTLKAVIQTKAFDMTAFMTADEEGCLSIRSSFGWKRDWLEAYDLNPLNIKNKIFDKLILSKHTEIFESSKSYHELQKAIGDTDISSMYIYPLSTDNGIFGLLLTANIEAKPISEHQSQLLSGIADQSNIAIQNLIKLNSEIRKSSTDGLTGIYNRRYFDEQLNVAVKEANSKNHDMSLIMMDIDNFKKYNDTYGHPAGDYLLKKLAATASGCVRGMDIVARYGGEEFVIILNNANNDTALSIAERIRHAVENMYDDKLKTKVTISLGVSTLSESIRDSKALLDFADKSLYHAKHNGKNRVCFGWTTIDGN